MQFNLPLFICGGAAMATWSGTQGVMAAEATIPGTKRLHGAQVPRSPKVAEKIWAIHEPDAGGLDFGGATQVGIEKGLLRGFEGEATEAEALYEDDKKDDEKHINLEEDSAASISLGNADGKELLGQGDAAALPEPDEKHQKQQMHEHKQAVTSPPVVSSTFDPPLPKIDFATTEPTNSGRIKESRYHFSKSKVGDANGANDAGVDSTTMGGYGAPNDNESGKDDGASSLDVFVGWLRRILGTSPTNPTSTKAPSDTAGRVPKDNEAKDIEKRQEEEEEDAADEQEEEKKEKHGVEKKDDKKTGVDDIEEEMEEKKKEIANKEEEEETNNRLGLGFFPRNEERTERGEDDDGSDEEAEDGPLPTDPAVDAADGHVIDESGGTTLGSRRLQTSTSNSYCDLRGRSGGPLQPTTNPPFYLDYFFTDKTQATDGTISYNFCYRVDLGYGGKFFQIDKPTGVGCSGIDYESGILIGDYKGVLDKEAGQEAVYRNGDTDANCPNPNEPRRGEVRVVVDSQNSPIIPTITVIEDPVCYYVMEIRVKECEYDGSSGGPVAPWLQELPSCSLYGLYGTFYASDGAGSYCYEANLGPGGEFHQDFETCGHSNVFASEKFVGRIDSYSESDLTDTATYSDGEADTEDADSDGVIDGCNGRSGRVKALEDPSATGTSTYALETSTCEYDMDIVVNSCNDLLPYKVICNVDAVDDVISDEIVVGAYCYSIQFNQANGADNIFIQKDDTCGSLVATVGTLDTASSTEAEAKYTEGDVCVDLGIKREGRVTFIESDDVTVATIFSVTEPEDCFYRAVVKVPACAEYIGPYTSSPTSIPSSSPSALPSDLPSGLPSSPPSEGPSTLPSDLPVGLTSSPPSEGPSTLPSDLPSAFPSDAPSSIPSAVPSGFPTFVPSVVPSAAPSRSPSDAPSAVPSVAPSSVPSAVPSGFPTLIPSVVPSEGPSRSPSLEPSAVPSSSPHPSHSPTSTPRPSTSPAPSAPPSPSPSQGPSDLPSEGPSRMPSPVPSAMSSDPPSLSPSQAPSDFPSEEPSKSPAPSMSLAPSQQPSPRNAEVAVANILASDTTAAFLNSTNGQAAAGKLDKIAADINDDPAAALQTVESLMASQQCSGPNGPKPGAEALCESLAEIAALAQCDIDNGGCDQKCLFENGALACSCSQGYELLQDGKTCQDIDECAISTDDCDQVCNNTLGTFSCSCEEGYELAEDGKSCFKCFLTNEELRKAIDEYVCGNTTVKEGVIDTYGEIGDWCVSQLTDFSYAFSAINPDYSWRACETVSSFNEDISKWNTSSATTMESMFEQASAFNQPLNDWDVSNVQNFNNMFYFATSFNKPLDRWDTSSATRMTRVFSFASAFNQPLNDWDVSNVQVFDYMFQRALSFNQPLDRWNTSSATRMDGMFAARAFNQPLNDWDVSKVQIFVNMFNGASSFDQPLDRWNTSSATNMGSMFYEASAFNQSLNDWDVSNVQDFGSMFSNAATFNQPLYRWNTSSATNMAGMFSKARAFDQSLNDWDVSKVQSFASMFSGADVFNQPLNQWKPSSATEISFMFSNAFAFNQSLCDWNANHLPDSLAIFTSPPPFDRTSCPSTDKPQFNYATGRWSPLCYDCTTAQGE